MNGGNDQMDHLQMQLILHCNQSLQDSGINFLCKKMQSWNFCIIGNWFYLTENHRNANHNFRDCPKQIQSLLAAITTTNTHKIQGTVWPLERPVLHTVSTALLLWLSSTTWCMCCTLVWELNSTSAALVNQDPNGVTYGNKGHPLKWLALW